MFLRVLFVYGVSCGIFGGIQSNKVYKDGETVPIFISPMTSNRSQVTLSYYTSPVCTPDNLKSQYSGGIGGMILGDVVQSTSYTVNFDQNQPCNILCDKILDQDALEKLENIIRDEYTVSLYADDMLGSVSIDPIEFIHYYRGLSNWSVDLLPENPNDLKKEMLVMGNKVYVLGGYPIGVFLEDENKYILFNHLDFEIDHNAGQIVGFSVTPRSVADSSCSSGEDFILDLSGLEEKNQGGLNKSQPLSYTYSVTWKKSDVSYGTRWDSYIRAVAGPSDIRWSSILNGMNLVLLFSTLILSILFRILRKDVSMYNSITTDIEALRAETGWKLLHGDIFRKPRFSKLLAACLGTGAQLSLMAIIIIILGGIGFLNLQQRGSVLTWAIILFSLFGIIAGYVSARFNRLLQQNYQNILYVTISTATLYTGTLLTLHTISSIIQSHVTAASQYVPRAPGPLILADAGSFAAESVKNIKVYWSPTVFISALLLFLCTPLIFIGSLYAYRQADIDLPVKTNLIPRHLVRLPWYIRSHILCPLSGLAPFSVAFGEMIFVSNSIWQHKLYYLFGTLITILILTMLVSALVSIFATYLAISHECHRWWWRAWWSSGFSAVWMFIAAIVYYFVVLDLDLGGTVLYFTNIIGFCYTVWLITGSIGTLSSFLFLKYIYGCIKID